MFKVSLFAVSLCCCMVVCCADDSQQEKNYDLHTRVTLGASYHDADTASSTPIEPFVGPCVTDLQVSEIGLSVHDLLPSITTFTYDSEENEIERAIDYSRDGSINRWRRQTFSHADQLLTQHEWSDAGINFIRVYEYNDAGDRTFEGLDDEADGVVDSWTESFFDGDHLLMREEDYWDGELEHTSIYTYTSDRHLRTLVRRTADGSVIRRELHRYNDLRQRVLWARRYSGVNLELTQYRYDSRGNQILEEHSVGFDRTPSWRIRQRYNRRNLLAGKRTVMFGSEEDHVRFEWFVYGDDDRLLVQRDDHDGDGRFDVERRYEYNDVVGQHTWTVRFLPDGRVYSVDRIEYDEAWNILHRESDIEPIGELDWVWDYGYACWESPIEE